MNRLFIYLGCVVVLLLLGAGCSRARYQKSADREASRIIAQKTGLVPNMDAQFSIEELPRPNLSQFPIVDQPAEFLGEEASLETGSHKITLAEALELAVRHSRAYQNRKELLYLGALNLSLSRHRFAPIFSGSLIGAYQESRSEIELGVDQVIEERSVTVGGDATFDLLLASGARIAIDFASDFLRFVTGDPDVATSSALVGTISQPLLRGAGAKVARENLTQAERDMLYSMRDFTVFRKDFSIGVARSYYGVLQDRDTVRNSWLGLQSFRQNVELSRSLSEEGRLKQADLDRLRQAELSTETEWINAVRRYRQSLDNFKIQLGLSPEAPLILDDAELGKLSIDPVDISVEQAVQVALVTRLDLYTEKEQAEDAARQVEVAANLLKPGLDLFVSGRLNRTGSRPVPIPNLDTYEWSAGLDLDLPLDRKSERNDYRAALIAQKRADRELALAIDTVKLDIHDNWRSLIQAQRNYQNSELGVKLSERRVEEQRLLAELGRGTALDLVDAENDLINARIQSTEALINHTLARLQFYRDMGILYIQPGGQWEIQETRRETGPNQIP